MGALNPLISMPQLAEKLGEIEDFFKALSYKKGAFFFSCFKESYTLISWSSNYKEVLGCSLKEILGEGNVFLRKIYSEDRFRIINSLEECSKGKGNFSALYRWQRSDTKQIQWLFALLKPSLNSTTVLNGLIVDITSSLKPASLEETDTFSSLDTIFNVLSIGVLIIDESEVVRHINLSLPLWESLKSANLFKNKEMPKKGVKLGDLIEDKNFLANLKREIKTAQEGKIPQEAIKLKLGTQLYKVNIFKSVHTSSSIHTVILIQNCTEEFQNKLELYKLGRYKAAWGVLASLCHKLRNTFQVLALEGEEISSIENNITEEDHDKIKGFSAKLKKLTKEGALLLELISSSLPVELYSQEVSLNQILTELACSGALVLQPELRLGQSPLIYGDSKRIKALLHNLINSIGLTLPPYASYIISTDPLKHITVLIKDIKSEQSDDIYKQIGGWLSSPRLRKKFLQTSCKWKIKRKEDFIIIELLFLRAKKHFLKETPPLIKDKNFTPREETVVIIDDDPFVTSAMQSFLKKRAIKTLDYFKDGLTIEKIVKNNGIKVVVVDALIGEEHGRDFIRKLKKAGFKGKILGFTGATKADSLLLKQAGAEEVVQKPVNPKLFAGVLEKYLKG